MIIQRAEGQADLESIGDLENALFENAFGIGTLQREFEWSYVVVARDNMDCNVGYAIVRPCPALPDLLRIGVMPSFQNKGIGTALLEHVMEAFGRPLMLTVRKKNTPALEMYKRRGFVIVATTEESWLMKR